MLGAAFGVGFVLGPALGGVLGSVNPRLPFRVAACLTLVNGMYGLFVLPESLKLENRAQVLVEARQSGGLGGDAADEQA